MKEHVYRISKKRVIGQSFAIWLFAALQVAANVIMLPKFAGNNQYGPIFFINFLFTFLTVPSVYIFINYLKYSMNRDFIVTYNSLKMVDRKNNLTTEINSPEIERIELHQNLYPHSPRNLLPWSSQEYFCFIDKNGKKIIVPSYIMSIIEFWTDSLTRRVNSDKLTRYESLYPLIKP